MKIAVIGSGISGLGAAYILSRSHEVHLFEASNRLGGHAHTSLIKDQDGDVPVDTGFLVYNELTYPHLMAFFAHLKVNTAESDMSLSIRNSGTGLEWSGTNLNSIFGQRKNLLKPSFHLMLLEILRFHREVENNLSLARRHGWTVGDLLAQRKFSASFSTNYLLPMAAAIWSTPEKGMLGFPAATFLNFLINHKLVQVNDRPKWRTVTGGSVEYVNKVAAQLAHVHMNAPVTAVVRSGEKIKLKTGGREVEFDRVIFATHAPVTSRILQNQNGTEREILSQFRTEPNAAVLHQDRALMPREERCWAAWNVFANEGFRQSKVSLSYHLNRLQQLKTRRPYFLTLNPSSGVNAVDREFSYDHPLFNQAAIRAQAQLSDIQGIGGVYYAGAWTRYGFHEDGLLSAVRVASLMNVTTPWKVA